MSDLAVHLDHLGKMYRLYPNPMARAADMIGLHRLLFWRNKTAYPEFWALRNIDLKLERGQRIGIIGRNGAGKSTLLKIICGTLEPTEGSCKVNGNIQALLDTGTSFHPDFSGRENIRASLSYKGMAREEISRAEEEIIDFAELEDFIDQPVNTYSLGMYSRLAFAIATSVKPDILVIDEVLGSGDAYFASKCAATMKGLVEKSGATVILVSHSTDAILRYCEFCIWLERGETVLQGTSMDVVKAYSAFINKLEDRRLKAKNRKRSYGVRTPELLDGYRDAVAVQFDLRGRGSSLDVSRVELLEDGQPNLCLNVGGLQDIDSSHPAFLPIHPASVWSQPERDDIGSYRKLTATSEAAVPGQVFFSLYDFNQTADNKLRIRYRLRHPGQLTVHVKLSGKEVQRMTIEPDADVDGETWRELDLPLTVAEPRATTASIDSKAVPKPKMSQWEGTGELVVSDIRLEDADGEPRAVFEAGEELACVIRWTARQEGRFPLIPSFSLYRLDGVPVSINLGPREEFTLHAGEVRSIRMTYPKLNLGSGHYVVSVGLHRDLQTHGDSPYYDIVDRSIEFKVINNEPFNNGIFRHPDQWQHHEVRPQEQNA